jgi:hypothetical protein
MFKKMVVLSSTLLFSGLALAEPNGEYYATIDQVGSRWNRQDVIFIGLSAAGAAQVPASESNSGYPVVIPLNDPLKAENLALALSAFHAKSKLSVTLKGCYNGHIRLGSINLYK